MNICLTHLRHAYTGGSERYLNYIATYLAERDHRVTILCRSHAQSPHPAVRFRTLRGPAPFGRAHKHWRFARAVDAYMQQHRSEYDVVYAIGRTWSQDVLRLGGGTHMSFLENMSALERGADAAPAPLGFKNRALLALQRRSLAPSANRKIVCNSQMVRADVIARFGVAEHSVEVIYNGVDLELFNPERNAAAGHALRNSQRLRNEELVFVFLGSGFKRKGLDLLLPAFGRMAADHPRARLLVAGHDSDSKSYQRLAREAGIADRVRFLGSRSDPEACLAAADVFVLPTRYDPFANATLEALASGLPVITTDANGGAEIIEDDGYGSVVSLRKATQTALEQALRHWCDRDRIEKTAPLARDCAERHDVRNKMAAAEQLLCNVASDIRNDRDPASCQSPASSSR